MPYSQLDPHAFWRLCRDDPAFRIAEIWQPKFAIGPGDRIATAGSCFAQNIARYLRRSNLTFFEVEKTPAKMPDAVARRFGYGLYSARYGNLYTARQLWQLLEDTRAGHLREEAIWEREGRFFDALRPGVEPEGLTSAEEVRAQRRDHLRHVARMMAEMDVFVFTLGLTETWEDVQTGTVFPSAPGVIAGAFDPARHGFRNQGFAEVLDDMRAALAILRTARPGLKVLLTVSPVPLTATASGDHVLAATTYSKSVLRAVAGELARNDPDVDYFPSFEIVMGLPFGSTSYEQNLRSVNEAAVARVMGVFFGALGAGLDSAAPAAPPPPATGETLGETLGEAEICEEALLEAFAPR